MSKERLTERFSNGQAAVKGCGANCNYGYKYCVNHVEDCPTITEIYDKLAEYEDLEEQGLLLRLPCKVGDTLYKPEWGHILAYKVSGVSFNVSKFKLFQNGVLEKVYPDYSNKPFFKCLDEQCDFDDIGKNIFLTQSEAEEKLRELEGK